MPGSNLAQRPGSETTIPTSVDMRSRRTSVISLLIIVVNACAGALAAQTPSAIGTLMVDGSLRTRGEHWQWFEPAGQDNYTFSGTLIRAGVAQQGARVGWRLELGAPILLGLPNAAIQPAPYGQSGTGASYYAANDGEENIASIFLKQAYLRLGTPAGTAGHGVRLGRFEFIEGGEVVPGNPDLATLKRDRIAHRLIGNFGWSHVGRSFDGVHYSYTGAGANLTAVAARPTQGVFDVDGWPSLDVGVAYLGLTLPQAVDAEHPGEGRLFALAYIDYRDEAGLVKVDNRPADRRQADQSDIAIATVGGHYIRGLVTEGGMIDFLLWGAVQAGSWGGLHHRAWAGAAEVGFQTLPDVPLRPWFRMGWSVGSGDDDPEDDAHRTFLQPLPTPRLYARLPVYNMMNTQEVFGSLILRPTSWMTVRSDIRNLWLTTENDLWYSGGGAFEPQTFGFAGRPSSGHIKLGLLVDTSIDLRLSRSLTASMYFGYMDGEHVVERLFEENDVARLGYIELEYRP